MRRKLLIFIAIISCVLAHAVPHGTENEDHDDLVAAPQQSDVPSPVPSNGTPASGNPSIAYAPPKEDAHTHDDDMDMGMDGMTHEEHHHNATEERPISPEEMSYWLWPEHRGLLYTHILLMVISWGFLLPIGTFLLLC
jgi:Domain of unknown function (DUF2427)